MQYLTSSYHYSAILVRTTSLQSLNDSEQIIASRLHMQTIIPHRKIAFGNFCGSAAALVVGVSYSKNIPVEVRSSSVPLLVNLSILQI